MADDFVDERNVRLAEASRFRAIPNSVFPTHGDETTPAVHRVKVLDARYAVGGKLRHSDGRSWVAEELVDVSSRAVLSAANFEGTPDRLMQVRDKIMEKSATAVFTTLSDADRSRMESRKIRVPQVYGKLLQRWRTAGVPGLTCPSMRRLSEQRIHVRLRPEVAEIR